VDHFPNLKDLQPVCLLGGMGLFLFALMCALTGEAPARYRAWAYRDEEPKRFWQRVAIYLLAGLFIFSVGLYSYLTSN
jgi:hypothetical protein